MVRTILPFGSLRTFSGVGVGSATMQLFAATAEVGSAATAAGGAAGANARSAAGGTLGQGTGGCGGGGGEPAGAADGDVDATPAAGGAEGDEPCLSRSKAPPMTITAAR